MEKYVFISGVCKYHVYQDVMEAIEWRKTLAAEGLIINMIPWSKFAIQEFQVPVN